jgi:hypothetical protein
MSTELGTNLDWDRRYSWTEVPRPRNDSLFPGRIPNSIRSSSVSRLIVTVNHSGLAKPWWITAGRLVIEANFQFDAVSGLGNQLVVHQQQLLLNKANLINVPEYVFPYGFSDTRYNLIFHWNKWLKGVNVEVFEYDV